MLEQFFDHNVRRVPVLVYWTLIGVSLTAILTVVAFALWLSGATNRVAGEQSVLLVDSAVKALTEQIHVSVRDYAKWNEAHAWFVARDDEALFSNLGSGATDADTFDLLYLLAPDGTALYAYESGGDGSDLTTVDRDVAAMVAAALADTPLVPAVTVSGTTLVNGRIAVFAATRIQPDDLTGIRPADLGLLVGATYLSEELLAGLGDRLLIADLHVPRSTAESPEDPGSLVLRDLNGVAVGVLHWELPRPGDLLWRQSVPIILAVGAVFVAATVVIGRVSANQTAALLRERAIARTDPLTGLPNRIGLEELLVTPRIREALTTGRAALLYLDLNGFKALNDAHGHDAGDLALRITAQRLLNSIRHGDFVARVGGDEFVCLVIDQDAEAAAHAVAARIFAGTGQVVRIDTADHLVRPSIGIAVAGQGLSWQSLMSRADIAMYQAKSSGLTRAVLFAEDMVRASVFADTTTASA